MPETAWLSVVGARRNNLKNITVHIPLSRFVCITGVSGSGKSSLINDIIRERLLQDLNGAVKADPGEHDAIKGTEHLDKVVGIDQSPIGRTPRSNPATYVKVFDYVRDLFAQLPDSRVRGYKPGRFSFNVPPNSGNGGRCEACEGNGANKIEMDFLADIWVTCPACQGKRFNRETLQVRFKGKNIADVLEMTVAQAIDHFATIPKIMAMLGTLHRVGLDYIQLGQSSTTLSGGEAQRVKLARELSKKMTGRTLYILDEPTTGLHFDDIKKLLRVLHDFVDAGNTVIVIEHNTDVMKTADWMIDLGPEGGEGGGRIVAEGTPEDIARCKKSFTGQALSAVLPYKGRSQSVAQVGHAAPSVYKRGKTRSFLTKITVEGAKQHNLKDLHVSVPRGRTTVFCGPSGSGKTSLAMDTIYAEGQRRYVESLSAYARQFLGQVQKPRVDQITGLSPAIAIEQRAGIVSPRSTVGTVTEIYDYMRVLWARLGSPFCPQCGGAVGAQSVDEMVDRIIALGDGTRALLLAPVDRVGPESYEQLWKRERANGFTRARVNGIVYEFDGEIPIDDRKISSAELVVERLIIKKRQRTRLSDSVEQALAVGSGEIRLAVLESTEPTTHSTGELRFSQRHACEECGRCYDELTPHHFSFNGRLGWCSRCEGLGVQQGASPDAVVVHPFRSILDGALAGWENVAQHPFKLAVLSALASHIGFDAQTSWNELCDAHHLAILQGCGDAWIDLPEVSGDATQSFRGIRFRWRGFFPAIDRATRASWQYRKKLENLVTDVPCNACGGSRLRPESQSVVIGGRRIEEICNINLDEALQFFRTLKLNRREKKVAGELLKEITSRLQFLIDVGLDYLTLHRSAPTLSGGEAQRIRLASQIGSGLTGVLYVLDEPTIGLHPRDNRRLISALRRLRDLGNSLILVEHDRDVIEHADWVLDFGPGAGHDGGEIIAQATPRNLHTQHRSLTGRYLAGKDFIPVPTNRRPVVVGNGVRDPDRWLRLVGARHNNLREIDVDFPLGRFIAVTGVSGSGKSSLINDTLYNALAARIHRARLQPGGHQRIDGAESIDKVINVDQSPIGSTPSSNPATYTGVFDLVRELYAKLPESKVRGYTPNRFSFNRPGGRCEACFGNGRRCIEMHFLPDVWVECEECKGTRYVRETLDVRFKDRSIADVLDLRVTTALELFSQIPRVRRMLQMLDDVGLGYVRLGQPAPTLSGGEAQRVKLAAELGRPSTGKTLYILDEPTTGLHFDDLRKLLDVLHRLVDMGNTVICIEHNLDVIKTADYIIDIGPEAAARGGTVVAAGSPETVTVCPESETGRVLAPVLKAGPLQERQAFDPNSQQSEEATLEGPIDFEAVAGTKIKMPWEVDGQRWHTVDHVDRKGKPVQWSPDVLLWIVKTIQKIRGFEPTHWADRARVEIRAKGAKTMWFVHLLTGGRDLLEMTVRVPARHFDNKTVVRMLKVKTLDERDDLPIYGQWSRVRLRASSRDFDDIRILLRDMNDIDRNAFRTFFKKAADAYFLKVRESLTDPVSGQPWKSDGRRWHLSQQSVRDRRNIQWQPATLLQLMGKINKIEPEIRFDWSGKASVAMQYPLEKTRAGKIVTNMAAGLRFELRVPNAELTPMQIEKLGENPSIQRKNGFDIISFWATMPSDVDAAQFEALLKAGGRLAIKNTVKTS